MKFSSSLPLSSPLSNFHVPLSPSLRSSLVYQVVFKTSISFAGASLWNSLPQNIKSCIFPTCFKRNLHKYMSEKNLSSDLDGFVWITRLSKNFSVVYMYAYERHLILMFLHIYRNCETALINCLIVLIIFVCGIVVFICVCNRARTGC